MFNRFTIWIIASPFILLVLSSLLSENAQAHAHHNAGYASVATLKSQLANPKAFHVEQVRVTDAGAACIQYSARDPSGMVGRAQAVVVGPEVARSDSPAHFHNAWDR